MPDPSCIPQVSFEAVNAIRLSMPTHSRDVNAVLQIMQKSSSLEQSRALRPARGQIQLRNLARIAPGHSWKHRES